jgi:hypothetical protein
MKNNHKSFGICARELPRLLPAPSDAALIMGCEEFFMVLPALRTVKATLAHLWTGDEVWPSFHRDTSNLINVKRLVGNGFRAPASSRW